MRAKIAFESLGSCLTSMPDCMQREKMRSIYQRCLQRFDRLFKVTAEGKLKSFELFSPYVQGKKGLEIDRYSGIVPLRRAVINGDRKVFPQVGISVQNLDQRTERFTLRRFPSVKNNRR